LLAAYIHYFLPWNLYRLAWLLPGLDLLPDPLPEGEIRLLDLGSGPLTLPLALWSARPDLRGRPLDIVCADVASRPMEVGREALRRLAGETSPWRVDLTRLPLEKALNRSGLHLILAGNVLNEMRLGTGESREERLGRLLSAMSRALRPGGRILLVEPGTRPGGALLVLARSAALERGFHLLSPCPHDGPCPMRGQSRSPAFAGWCHFTAPARDAPETLLALSRRARLEKESLALSCLLLERGDGGSDPEADPGEWPEGNRPGPAAAREEKGRLSPGVRIISQPIRLPCRPAPARYACCAKGLALVLDAAAIPSGGAARADWPCPEERDRKTGALLLTLSGSSCREPVALPAPSRALAAPSRRPRGGGSGT
jgi:SAM-dependent methyltransferase